jgi:predicted transcriptional regulator of viral defense system
MKILRIKEQLKKLKIFTLKDILTIFPNFRQATLYDWENQGYVKKVRNKYYIFSDQEISDLDFYMISNKIYQPSYISLELALNHYGIIPEAVLKITAITTRKTNTFETDLATFIYKSIKPELFWGYKIIEHESIGIKLADLEKAILDYLYINPDTTTDNNFQSLRINSHTLKELLDYQKFYRYIKIFDNEQLSQRAENLINYIDSNA